MNVLLVWNGPATTRERAILARREVALLEELTRRNVGVSVALLGDAGGLLADLRSAGIETHVILPPLPPHLSSLARLPVAAVRLRKLLARLEPDLIEASEPMPAVAAGMARLRLPTRPALVYRRQHAGGRPRLRYASRLATHLSDRTLVSCAAMQRTASIDDRCALERIEIANPGTQDPEPIADAAIESARRTMGIAPTARVIGAISRFRYEKGLDVLIRSLAHLGESSDVHLVIAGTGPEEQVLRRLAARSAIPVHFIGHQEDVQVWLRVADLIAIPSRRESFGRLTLEAMAAGRPLVATRVGGLVEAIVDGESGSLVAVDDERALASAIQEMLSDPALAKRRGDAARARFLSRYTIAHMATARYQAWQRSLALTGVR